MADLNLTRRSLMGAMAFAAVPAAICAPAIAGTPTATAWDAAMAHYIAAKQAYEQNWAVFSPICDRHSAELPDPYTVDLTGHNIPDRRKLLHMDDLDQWEREIRANIGVHHPTDRETLLYLKMKAVDRVRAYRAERERINRKYRYEQLSAENERLCDVFADAERALMNMPAPHLQALRWKLDQVIVIENGEMTSWTTQWVAQTQRDIQRLLA
jgi:hypothetical protein